ncbi:MAG: oligosaccharide flippase family protein, partial [Thermoleophilaceae bacterium]
METKAIRGIPWTLLAFASTKAVSLITTLVLARLLVPSDFGVVAFAGLAMALLSQVSELGLTPALIVRHD